MTSYVITTAIIFALSGLSNLILLFYGQYTWQAHLFQPKLELLVR